MAFRLLTLDCANTLLRGAWDPVAFALWAARDAGLCLPKRAGEAYGERLRTHYPALLAANRTGDPWLVRSAYIALGEAWLGGLDVDPGLATEVVDAAGRLLTDPTSGLFEPFEDTVPFLVEARRRGRRLAIVSNWDVSLDAVLKAQGLLERVDETFASLVVGAEKPDPTMIRLAMASAKVSPSETLHVGDDPVDDLGAAVNAGVCGVLIQRSAPLPPRGSSRGKGPGDGGTIHSLMELLEWID